MDKKETSPELPRAELLPTQEEQVPANPPSRKRQLDSDDNAEPQTKRARTTRPTSGPARLTRKNLALFDKMGQRKKKKTSDPTNTSTSIKTTSTTTSGFADQARNNGILGPVHSKPPANLEAIRERHARSRATASPPESEYKRYAKKVSKAGNEATMVFQVSTHMLKEYGDDGDGYDQAFNRAFTNLPKGVGFNDGLSAPQPDFIEGLEKEEFRPFPVGDVPGATLYKDDPYSLALPHLAGEWKGPDGNIREAGLQSAYDGAAMVHARNQALAYMGRSDPPGHAEVTTFTTDGTNLNMYAHYATPSEEDNNTLEYHQFLYASTNVKDSYQGHKEGRRGLRNQQDHAKQQSYALRDQLKEHWRQRHDLQTITEGAVNEDEAGYEVVELSCQPTPDASLPPENDDALSSRQKRKASPPQKSPNQSPNQTPGRHRKRKG